MKSKERPWEGSLEEEGYKEGEYIPAHEPASPELSPEDLVILKDLRSKGKISKQDHLLLKESEGKEDEHINEFEDPEHPSVDFDTFFEEERAKASAYADSPVEDFREADERTAQEERAKDSAKKLKEEGWNPESPWRSRTPKGPMPKNQKLPEHQKGRTTAFKYDGTAEIKSHGKHIPKKPWSKKGKKETIRKPKLETEK